MADRNSLTPADAIFIAAVTYFLWQIMAGAIRFINNGW